MLSPEYIHCEDCSKNEWTLNNEEKKHLCEIVNSFWEILLTEYENELYSYDGKRRPEILKAQVLADHPETTPGTEQFLYILKYGDTLSNSDGWI